MARRRRVAKKRPTTRRRRRVSGISSSNLLMTVAGIAGGAIVARVAANMAAKSIALNPKIVSAGQIALGVFLPKFIKSQLGKDLGAGMIAVGGLSLAQNLGVIAGVEDELTIAVNGFNGSDSLTAVSGYGNDYGFSVNGTSELSAVNGIDDMDGYDY
jgi:hypothetical protein